MLTWDKGISKIEILRYIDKVKFIKHFMLRERFGYSFTGAKMKLTRLKKEGLVKNSSNGMWSLTNEGYRRLIYYDRKEAERKTKQGTPLAT